MKLLVTGADQPLGGMLVQRLAATHEVVAVCAPGGQPLADVECHSVDLGVPEQVEPLVVRTQAVVHALPYDAVPLAGPRAEQELLERVARSTYVLCTASVHSGLKRLVLISRLSLFDAYPADYIITPDWHPMPAASAAALAPHMAELVAREIARAGQVEAICLRFGALDQADGTLAADALAAVETAIAGKGDSLYGHGWWLEHVVSGGRYQQPGR